jgi:hypothetical protein
MWIIPKQLTTCLYVQDTVELISDCDQKSKILEQSAMWRSKPSPSKTWSRRLKAKSSTLHLYTRILKPSRSASFVDAWTSSLAGSPVSPSQAQEKRQGQKTLDISSPTSSKESQSVNPTSCSSKTLKESSQVNSKATNGATPKAHPFCSMSLESWKEWVTNQRLLYSLRLKSEPLTKEEEFLLWESEKDCLWSEEQTCGEISKTSSTTPHTLQNEEPLKNLGNPLAPWATPQARDWKGPNKPASHREQRFSPSLPSQIEKQANWATPTARDWKGGEGRSVGSKEGTDLPSQVDKNWPTPPACSAKGSSYTAYLRKCINRVKAGGAPFAPTLQVSVENPNADTSLFKDLDLTKDTEQLIKQIKEIKGRNWPTPPASQRGEDYTAYLRKCINRVKAGGAPFAPTLQVAAENPNADTSLFKDLDLTKDTEQLIKQIKGKDWPTPSASQRGEDYETYLRKCIDRLKSGGSLFGPSLQVSAENPDADRSLFKDLDLTKDTEQLIKDLKGKNWPTPKALEIDESVEQWAKRREKPASKMRGSSLTVAVKIEEANWPTPTAFCTSESVEQWEKRRQNPKQKMMGPSLSTAVKIEEGNWATPRAGKTTTENLDTWMKRHRQGSVATMPLPLQASLNWATPTTRDWKGAYSEESQKNKPRNLLPDQAQKNWATPLVRDHFEVGLNAPLPCRKDGRSRGDTMPQQVLDAEKYRGKLNPRWVETLMGLDVGWVMPDTVEDADLHTACTNRTDELRLLGNGVVPDCASRAFIVLWSRLNDDLKTTLESL